MRDVPELKSFSVTSTECRLSMVLLSTGGVSRSGGDMNGDVTR